MAVLITALTTANGIHEAVSLPISGVFRKRGIYRADIRKLYRENKGKDVLTCKLLCIQIITGKR